MKQTFLLFAALETFEQMVMVHAVEEETSIKKLMIVKISANLGSLVNLNLKNTKFLAFSS